MRQEQTSKISKIRKFNSPLKVGSSKSEWSSHTASPPPAPKRKTISPPSASSPTRSRASTTRSSARTTWSGLIERPRGSTSTFPCPLSDATPRILRPRSWSRRPKQGSSRAETSSGLASYSTRLRPTKRSRSAASRAAPRCATYLLRQSRGTTGCRG